MGTYCISDIHGCHDEFMALLELIGFDPARDMLYILGDVIDRGGQSLECLRFVRKSKNIMLLRGNHEQMMLDYYDGKDFYGNWNRNGNSKIKYEMRCLTGTERNNILEYIRKRPLYKTLSVNGRRYFLSHAGLNVRLPFNRQGTDDCVWSREEFYLGAGLKTHTVIFGHTPAFNIHGTDNCAVWRDNRYNNKICIDCGCVYGGALAALRLDDGEIFYVKSNAGSKTRGYTINPAPVSVNYLNMGDN